MSNRFRGIAVLVALVAGGMTAQGRAATLLLDFANTTSVNTNANATYKTDSPAYAAGALTTATTPNPVWNSPQGVGDVTSSILKYVDGTTATGVTYDLSAAVGSSSAAPTSIAFGATQPANTLNSGTAINSGIYTPGKVAAGGIYVSSAGASGTYTILGLRIAGLDLGTYDVYLTARNTNTSATTPQRVTAAGTDATAAYTLPAGYTTLANTTTAGGGAVSTAAYVEGENYLKLSVTLTADNPYLTITTRGGTSGEARGWLNSVEIVPVAVPEPASLGVLALGASAALRRRR